MHQQQTAFENIVGKEEIARKEQFLLFPQCFLLNQKSVSPFVNIVDILSLFSDELEEPKIGIWSKGLKSALCGKGLTLLQNVLAQISQSRLCRAGLVLTFLLVWFLTFWWIAFMSKNQSYLMIEKGHWINEFMN